MTTTAHISVDGVTALSMVYHEPSIGPWWADVVLEDATDVSQDASGRVAIQVGDSLVLSGTVDAAHSGVFGEQRRIRVVGGGNGWATLLGVQGYHADNGVDARLVATDIATAAGEELGSFAPAAPSIGIDYARQSGTAARALEDVIGDVSWWVGRDGVTVVGTRPTSNPATSTYQILHYDPINRVAEIACDDLSSLSIGSILAAEERMPDAQTIRELRIDVTDTVATVYAWCGGSSTTRGRIAQALDGIISRVNARRIYGPRKYRVMRMSGDRVELQKVSTDVPDLGPLSLFPGLPGFAASLTPGAIVLVEFVEGDRTQPLITHFAGKDGTGWTPVSATIDVTTLLKLGQNATQFVALAMDTKARLDTLQAAHDAHTHPTAPTGPVSVPSIIVGPLGPIAATKVQAE